jgi:hypothetical protein
VRPSLGREVGVAETTGAVVLADPLLKLDVAAKVEEEEAVTPMVAASTVPFFCWQQAV